MSDKHPLMKRFWKIAKRIDRFNSKKKTHRFYAMKHFHGEKTVDIGMYDSKTKKYALTGIYAHDAEKVVNEIEKVLEKAGA